MNDYFVNIKKNIDIPENVIESIPDINLQIIDPIDKILYLYREHPSITKIKEHIQHPNTFSFEMITQTLMENNITDLNVKKAAGADEIPPRILKSSVNVIKEPLTRLFNSSIKEGHFPSDLKYANITPLFKKEDTTNKENYRPISILPSISKVFERIILQQITFYVNDILSPYLCGFRKGYSAHHALLRLFDKLNKSLDRKKKIGIFLMDLSKAFDCIPHELLIAKIHAYGFDKRSLKLIYSYLKGRLQRVKINETYSSWKEILYGVPQGSVLGPFLFNIFLNDIFYFIEKSDIYITMQMIIVYQWLIST